MWKIHFWRSCFGVFRCFLLNRVTAGNWAHAHTTTTFNVLFGSDYDMVFSLDFFPFFSFSAIVRTFVWSRHERWRCLIRWCVRACGRWFDVRQLLERWNQSTAGALVRFELFASFMVRHEHRVSTTSGSLSTFCFVISVEPKGFSWKSALEKMAEFETYGNFGYKRKWVTVWVGFRCLRV